MLDLEVIAMLDLEQKVPRWEQYNSWLAAGSALSCGAEILLLFSDEHFL